MLTSLDLILVVVYFITVLFIGWKVSRNEDNEGFLIGNRQVSTASLNATVSASLTGGSALAAYVAFLYLWGISAFWIFIGVAVGILAFIPFAIKIKKEGDIKGHYTMLDFLNEKFGKGNIIIAAGLLMLMFIAIILAEMIIGGKVFALVTGLPYWLSIIISSVVILIYVYLGGVKSDIRTDLFQYLMFFLLLVIGFMLFQKTSIDTAQLNILSIGVVQIIGLIIMGIFIIFVSADVWQRAYSAKDIKTLKMGFTYAALSYLLVGIIISVIGLIIKSNFPNINPNDAMIHGFSQLPAGLLGIGLIAILAAAMSTIDTGLIVGSLFVSRDIISRYKQTSKKELIRLTRIFIISLSLLTTILAMFTDNLVFVIYNMFNFALILAPAVTFSFFFDLKKKAIMWSLILGIISAIILVSFGQITP
ncbi:MAG: hypothetical protein AABW65_01900, partial [Nanoarchaeota archaeon]